MAPLGIALLLLAGLAVGFALAWWMRRNELALLAARNAELAAGVAAEADRAGALRGEVTRLTAELAAARASLAQLDTLAKERDAARADLDAERRAHAALRTAHATYQADADARLAAANEKLELLRAAGADLRKEFENLANRIFEEKSEKFARESKESLGNLLKPVSQQLADFRKKVEDVYESEMRDRTSLKAEIQNLQKASERAGTQAESLARALTGESKVRGNWGEISLERILEESGLRKGHEYDVQESGRNEDGQRLRPDVIVRLPERKAVIIDSKVALVAYERYHAAQTEEERAGFLAEHIAALKAHIRSLSARSYQDIIGLNSLDLVLMFVPVEPAYLLALEHDASLYADAFNRKILIVSPTTLMGTLQIIHNIWRYEWQNKNAIVIAEKAGALYDQFVLFAEALEEIGRCLGKAQEAFETTRKRLVDGRGNLVSRAEALRTLGIKAKRKLDAELLAEAGEEPAEALPETPTLPGQPEAQA
jgi:DNA recombination protein RmuC